MSKNLVQIIQDNPSCYAEIDNDCWTLYKEDPYNIPDNLSDEEEDNWNNSNKLISSDDYFLPLGDGGYGSGSSYGGDILQALAAIVGITVKSV